MNAASLTPRQVSLIHVKRSSVHSASNHLMRPAVALARYPSAPRASHRGRWVWASPLACRLATTSGRIEFTSHCGLVVHLLLLPTPPRGDAVAIGYGLGNVCPRWTCTTLISHALRRTSPRRRRGAPTASALHLPTRPTRRTAPTEACPSRPPQSRSDLSNLRCPENGARIGRAKARPTPSSSINA